LFHRAAATIIEPRRFHIRHAVMVVHSFSRTESSFHDYEDWCGLFGQQVRRGEISKLAELNGTTLYAGCANGLAKA
jgi:hypothetical protein